MASRPGFGQRFRPNLWLVATQDPELQIAYNRALGYLNIRLNEFNLAKTYLTNVLNEPHWIKAEDFTMAAYTYEQLGDDLKAQKIREQGLQFVMNTQKNKTETTEVVTVNS